jgi:hypothetical protein
MTFYPRKHHDTHKANATMSAAFAVFPILGGSGLLFGGGAALYADRRALTKEMRERESTQRRGHASGDHEEDLVLVRYLSAAIGDPRRTPHIFFLTGAALYMVGIIATACLQAHMMAETVSGSTVTQQVLLILYATLSGTGAFVMTIGARWFQPGSRNALVFHVICACVFMAFGFMYAGAIVSLANRPECGSGSTVAAVRIGFAIAGGVACFFNMLFAGGAGYASVRIAWHYAAAEGEDATDPERRLTGAEIRELRWRECALACGQIVIGICLSALTASGAAEIVDFRWTV